jgi:hypothetical protein
MFLNHEEGLVIVHYQLFNTPAVSSSCNQGAELLGDWVWSAPNSVHLEHPVRIYLLGHAPQHGVHGYVCGGGWANHRPGLQPQLGLAGLASPSAIPIRLRMGTFAGGVIVELSRSF